MSAVLGVFRRLPGVSVDLTAWNRWRRTGLDSDLGSPEGRSIFSGSSAWVRVGWEVPIHARDLFGSNCTTDPNRSTEPKLPSRSSPTACALCANFRDTRCILNLPGYLVRNPG